MALRLNRMVLAPTPTSQLPTLSPLPFSPQLPCLKTPALRPTTPIPPSSPRRIQRCRHLVRVVPRRALRQAPARVASVPTIIHLPAACPAFRLFSKLKSSKSQLPLLSSLARTGAETRLIFNARCQVVVALSLVASTSEVHRASSRLIVYPYTLYRTLTVSYRREAIRMPVARLPEGICPSTRLQVSPRYSQYSVKTSHRRH